MYIVYCKQVCFHCTICSKVIINVTIVELFFFIFQGPNSLSEKLMEEIIEDRRIFLIPALDKGVYFLRFAVCAERTNSRDIEYSFNVIKECTNNVMKNYAMTISKQKSITIDIDQQISHKSNLIGRQLSDDEINA